jgi:hypothetical protein
MKKFVKILKLCVIILPLAIVFAFVCSLLGTTVSNREAKAFIIKHECCIHKSDYQPNKYYKLNNIINYKIDFTDFPYYKDVTIQVKADSSYRIILWGDRNNWLWRIKLDKQITADIKYDRYNGKNI